MDTSQKCGQLRTACPKDPPSHPKHPGHFSWWGEARITLRHSSGSSHTPAIYLLKSRLYLIHGTRPKKTYLKTTRTVKCSRHSDEKIVSRWRKSDLCAVFCVSHDLKSHLFGCPVRNIARENCSFVHKISANTVVLVGAFNSSRNIIICSIYYFDKLRASSKVHMYLSSARCNERYYLEIITGARNCGSFERWVPDGNCQYLLL